jgi:hypothetical protein
MSTKHGIWRSIIVCALPALILIQPAMVMAGYQVQRLSPGDDISQAQSPQINDNGWVVWQSSFGIELWKGGGEPIRIFDTNYDPSSPIQINNKGWVVWSGYDGHDLDIFLWKGGGSPINISNNDYNDRLPQINNNGWVVWEGYDGQDSEIFLWKGGGSPIKITNNMYDDYMPQLNNKGWVVYQGWNGQNYQLNVWKGSGNPIQISNNNLYPTDPRINDNGWVVWENYNDIMLWKGSGKAIKLNDGNTIGQMPDINNAGWVVWYGHHSGVVLWKGGGKPISIGPTIYGGPQINEKGWVAWTDLDGVNLWTGSGPAQIIFPEPLNPEHSYYEGQLPQINNNGWVVWQSQEFSLSPSDVYVARPENVNMYSYKFLYGNGDYYTGTVFAPLEKEYYVGLSWTKQDENGQPGIYQITSMGIYNNGYAKLAGQVYVDSYKDGESGKIFNPVHKGKAVGAAYLGSEVDYILKDGVAAYKFGQGYYEADVGDKYAFRYYYGNGDYYQGYVYQAPSASGYYPGLRITKKNELGLNGYYEILSMAWTGDTAKYGQVYVDWYNDADRAMAQLIRPLNYATPMGKKYLGSEVGYLVSVSDAHKFGQGYWEADEY